MVTTRRQKMKTSVLLLSIWFFEPAISECPNACSAHGQCGSYDMCTCDRNWQGADCSQRTCPFGLSHVDTPKGDLDASNTIGDHDDVVLSGSTVYPYGTTEGYPYMIDSAGNVLSETAHNYMECSNKGMCDRAKGECVCLPGYNGAACQRASCPTSTSSSGNMDDLGDMFRSVDPFTSSTSSNAQIGECSGHGTCETIADIAFNDYENIYTMWDKDSTMGCKCDAGYGGADCSERMCKYGIDPLYTDDTTARVTQTTIKIETSDANVLSGEYSLRFYDILGEDYLTRPLAVDGSGSVNGKTHCEDVVEAMKELPDRIVPDVSCSQTVINVDQGFEYTLTFKENPGKLKEMEINEYLDGVRSTLIVSNGTYTANVYINVIGEVVDYFPTRCEGISVKLLADSADADNSWNADVRPGSLGYLTGSSGAFSTAEKKILKGCLGDSDWDSDNNVEVSNWDYGNVIESDGNAQYNMIGAYPHVVKIVPVPTSPGYNKFTHGEYHLVWHDTTATTNKEFRVANINNGANTIGEAVESYVYTTTGTVKQMGWGHTVTEIASNSSSTRIVGYFDAYSKKIYTNYDTSCENQPSVGAKNFVCVEKGAKLFVVDSCWGAGDLGAQTSIPFFGGPNVFNCADSTAVNYNTGNMYTVKKVYTVDPGSSTTAVPEDTIDISTDPTLKRDVDTYIIEVDGAFGWEGLHGDPENSNFSPSGAGRDTTWSDNTGVVTLFHFTPPASATNSYEYVNQCSNRGNCDTTSGLCKCFKGYTGDDCSVQSVLAVA